MVSSQRMSSHRYKSALLITLSFYLLAGFALWNGVSLQAPCPCLSQAEVIQIQVITPPPEPEPIPEPIPEPEPEPIPEPEPAPVKESEPEPKPIIEKKPEIPVKPIQAKKTVEQKPKKTSTKESQTPRKFTPQKSVNTAVPKAQCACSPSQLQSFLGGVRAKIEVNKTYPKIAARRKIEGTIRVTFDIQKNGTLSNIRVGGGPAILQKAVQDALQRSSPVAVNKIVAGNLPLTNVSVDLNFNLRKIQ